MATYIRNDNLDNFNAAMQNLAATSQRIRALNLEEEQLKNRQGINTSDWKAQGAFAGQNQPDIALQERKQELYGGVDAEQGGILAQLKKNYTDSRGNFDRAGYNKQLQVMGLQAAGSDPSGALNALNNPDKRVISEISKITSPVYDSQIAAYKESENANAPIRKENAIIDAYNRKAEIRNANKPKYRDKYEGNEVDQQQQLLRDTQMRLKNGGGINAYMAYITTGKAIADHYGHSFQPYPVEFFGMGGKSGSGSGKTEKMYIYNNDGQALIPIPLTAKEMRDPNIKKRLFEQYKETLLAEGITRWQDMKHGYASGDNFQPSLKEKIEKEMYEQAKAEKDQNALTMLNQWTHKDVGKGSTLIKDDDEAIAWLHGRGYRKDKSGKYVLDTGNQAAISNEPKKTGTPIYDFSTYPPKIKGYK